MPSVRNLYRSKGRCPTRHTTRMLCGARRPPPPDYLAIACTALREVIRIDKRLLPFMAEQREMLDRCLLNQEIQAALRKVYGDDTAPSAEHVGQTSGLPVGGPPGPTAFTSGSFPNDRAAAVRFLKEEQALAKTRAILALLSVKVGRAVPSAPIPHLTYQPSKDS